MNFRTPVYLDNNATTAVDPRVLESMLPYFTDHYGNAASRHHSLGWIAAAAAETAREQVAALIHAEPAELIFTSGATESVNLAIKGVYEMYAAKGNHIITCVTEHKAVLDTCSHIEHMGGSVTYLPVQADGLICPEQLEQAIRPETILIAVMYANNETGVIQPVHIISSIARKHGVLFFTDATQAVGKIPVAVTDDGIDLMAFSAHKLYGPKGVGALYLRRRQPRVRLIPQLDGGGQEKGIRSGTLNIPGIVGFGQACALCHTEMEAESIRLNELRNRLERELMEIGGVIINGHLQQRLPHMTNMSFENITGNSMIAAFNRHIALSAGSACNTALPEPSYVLKAMGSSDTLAYHALRIGLGRFTTGEELNYATDILKEGIRELRRSTDKKDKIITSSIN